VAIVHSNRWGIFRFLKIIFDAFRVSKLNCDIFDNSKGLNIQFFAAEPERIQPGGFVIISAIA